MSSSTAYRRALLGVTAGLLAFTLAVRGASAAEPPTTAKTSAGQRVESDVKNVDEVMKKVDDLTGGTPDVEVFWSRPVAVGVTQALEKAGAAHLPHPKLDWFNKYGHIVVALKEPGASEPTVFEIQGIPRGSLVKTYPRGKYIYGKKADLKSVSANERGMLSARATNVPPEAVHAMISYYKDLAERNRQGKAGYSLLVANARNALNRATGKTCELGNCAQWSGNALNTGKLLTSENQTQWPMQLIGRFIEQQREENPKNIHVIDWQQTHGDPQRPKVNPLYDRGDDPEPRPDFVVKVDERSGNAEVSRAERDKAYQYRPRFSKLPWLTPGKAIAAMSRGVKSVTGKGEVRPKNNPFGYKSRDERSSSSWSSQSTRDRRMERVESTRPSPSNASSSSLRNTLTASTRSNTVPTLRAR